MNESLKLHLTNSLGKGVRLDGRKLDDYREVSVEYGISKSAEGSARVKMGETEVLAGIKLSIAQPYPDTADQGSLMVDAQLLPLSSPEFETGPPSINAIETARVIDRGIREAKAIDVKKLCIEVGEKVWMVSIDVCTINDGGNVLDAAGLAAVAALEDAKFPAYDGTEIDYKIHTDEKLPLTKHPIPVTVYKLGDILFVDPTTEEQNAYDAKLTITTTNGVICALQKGGDAALTLDEIKKMVDLGVKKAGELRKKLKVKA